MDDFDLDLVDELCSSFCVPHPSEAPDDYTLKCVDNSSTMSSRKRTSTTINTLDTSVSKKVCLNDMTNQRDEMQTLDESALQMLVSLSLEMANEDTSNKNVRSLFCSAKNGNRPHSFPR
jgi:hypothetical protein